MRMPDVLVCYIQYNTILKVVNSVNCKISPDSFNMAENEAQEEEEEQTSIYGSHESDWNEKNAVIADDEAGEEHTASEKEEEADDEEMPDRRESRARSAPPEGVRSEPMILRETRVSLRICSLPIQLTTR